MPSLTLRTSLTLWNVVALGALMAAVSAAIVYDLRVQEDREIDNELTQRAEFFAAFVRNSPPGLPPPNRRPRHEPAVQTAGQTPPHHGDHLPLDREIERMQWFRGPRLIRKEGSRFFPDPNPMWDGDAANRGLIGIQSFTYGWSRGEPIRVFTIPVFREEAVIGVLQVARELGGFERIWSRRFQFIALLFPIFLGVAALGALFLTNRALGPIQLVTRTAADIGEQDLSRRLPVRGKDELAGLCATFNSMIERLESAFKSRAAAYARLEQAYEQQRRFTSDASHELRTPLTRIKIATSAALTEQQSNQEYLTALDVADKAADSMRVLIDQLLLLSRSDGGRLVPNPRCVELNALVQDVACSLPFAERLALNLTHQPVRTNGDRDMLSRVLINVLENAAQHSPCDSSICVSVEADNAAAAITVVDRGEGISKEHLPFVFERFYRVDSARARAQGGTGIGLAICKGIVEAHQGAIRIDSELNVGTTVHISLPLAAERAVAEDDFPQGGASKDPALYS